MRISDWSSDVCSSDLRLFELTEAVGCKGRAVDQSDSRLAHVGGVVVRSRFLPFAAPHESQRKRQGEGVSMHISCTPVMRGGEGDGPNIGRAGGIRQYHCIRSEEHTSELQSLMRISYAVFCLKKKI